MKRAATRNHSVPEGEPPYAHVQRMPPKISSTHVAIMLTRRPKTSPRKPKASWPTTAPMSAAADTHDFMLDVYTSLPYCSVSTMLTTFMTNRS